MTGLGHGESHGSIRLHGGAHDAAGVGLDAGGDVGGDDDAIALVDPLHRRHHVPCQITPQADAKEGIDDHMGGAGEQMLIHVLRIEVLQLDAAGVEALFVGFGIWGHFLPFSHQKRPYLHPSLVEHSGAGHAVPAVVAGAAEHCGPGQLALLRLVLPVLQGHIGQSPRRPLHEQQTGLQISVDGGLIQPVQLLCRSCSHGFSLLSLLCVPFGSLYQLLRQNETGMGTAG